MLGNLKKNRPYLKINQKYLITSGIDLIVWDIHRTSILITDAGIWNIVYHKESQWH